MTTNRTDLDLQLDQARRCDWYYFTLTALDRIKTNLPSLSGAVFPLGR